MAYEFVIQASCPRALLVHDPDDESLSDAIQTVFPMDTERAILAWHRVCVPLGYKYDVSLLVDDILGITEVMLVDERGARVVQWPSNTFAATWDITWDEEGTTVHAKWECVSGGIESLLVSRGSIAIPKKEFLAEWKSLLVVVERALDAAGYTESQLAGLSRLRRVIAALPGHGVLYGPEPESTSE
jgi:hypothetical protein